MSAKNQNVVSISFYGADMARGGKFSGALDRQQDYAERLGELTVFVPGDIDREAVQEDCLKVNSLRGRGAIVFAFRAYRAVTALSRSSRIDIIMVDNPHLGGLLGVVLRYRLGIPLIVHSMGDMLGNPWYRRERLSNRLKHVLMRFVFRAADVYRVSTQHEVQRLGALGYDTTKIVCVPFYIDRSNFESAFLRSSQKREIHRMLFVGRVGHQKDVPTLLRAFAAVSARSPLARLCIVGAGPKLAECQTLATMLKIEHAVEFKGSIPYDTVADEFARASLFVLPSLYEGTCMVLQEAAVARLPIVSTDTAGAVDFIGGTDAGWLAPVRDVDAFAKALESALSDEVELARCGDLSYKRLEQFSKESALESFSVLIESVHTAESRV